MKAKHIRLRPDQVREVQKLYDGVLRRLLICAIHEKAGLEALSKYYYDLLNCKGDKMGKVVLAKLIKRCPEKETAYDKNMNMEYWMYRWSDGSLGQGSLYQSQIAGLERGAK